MVRGRRAERDGGIGWGTREMGERGVGTDGRWERRMLRRREVGVTGNAT